MGTQKRNRDITLLPSLKQKEAAPGLEVAVHRPQDEGRVRGLEQQYRPFRCVHTAADVIQESAEQ